MTDDEVGQLVIVQCHAGQDPGAAPGIRRAAEREQEASRLKDQFLAAVRMTPHAAECHSGMAAGHPHH
jgi:hypothetical protein